MLRSISTTLFCFCVPAVLAGASDTPPRADLWGQTRSAALAAFEAGNYGEAERIGREALKLAGKDETVRLATAAAELGLTLAAERRYAEAAAQFERVLVIDRKIY